MLISSNTNNRINNYVLHIPVSCQSLSLWIISWYLLWCWYICTLQSAKFLPNQNDLVKVNIKYPCTVLKRLPSQWSNMPVFNKSLIYYWYKQQYLCFKNDVTCLLLQQTHLPYVLFHPYLKHIINVLLSIQISEHKFKIPSVESQTYDIPTEIK